MTTRPASKTIWEAAEYAVEQLRLYGTSIPGGKTELRGENGPNGSPMPYFTVRRTHSVEGSIYVLWDVDFAEPDDDGVKFRPKVCVSMPAYNAGAIGAVAFAYLVGQLSWVASTLQAQLDGLGPLATVKKAG